MKLISCYIENYGGISARKIDFSDGITEFCEANGYGKTTIASFIKAMFYGLDGYKSNTKEFVDRKRFYPFSGGKFGGNVVFGFGGDVYKVERFFGEKSETQDELVVFRNGEQFSGFGEKVGEGVFGLDKEAFERTLFIDASDVKISSTASIAKKLEGILGGGDDENFDVAVKKLKDAAGMYKKSRNANDYISVEKRLSDDLRADIENATAVKAALEPKYSALAELKKKSEAVGEELKLASTLNETLAAWETYDALRGKIKALSEEISAKSAEYPYGVPEETELARAEKAAAEITSLTALQKEKSEVGGKGEMLAEKFAAGLPSADERAEIEQSVREYSSVETEYLSAPEWIDGETPAVKSEKSEKHKAIAIIGALIAALGVAGLFINSVIGGVAIALGVALIIVGAFMSVNGKMDALKSEVKRERVLNPEKQRLKERLIALNRPIERFFIKYGYKEGGYEARLALLSADVDAYEEIVKSAQAADAAAKKREDEITRLRGEIDGVFTAKNIQVGNCAETIKAIRKYAVEIGGLKERLKSAEKEAAAYASAKNLKERPSAEKKDADALVNEQRELSDRITALEKDIRDGEWLAEKLDDLVSLKSKSDEKLKEYSEKHKLLSAAAGFLEEAEKNIIEKYVSPIKSEFGKYSAALEKALGEKVGMNKNFEISFEENGKERSEEHKSQGERSVIALCFRLALIENMFHGEKPFLVLDDPFVHLDNEHMTKVVTLLKELSGGFQILYFTCHDSRKLR